MAENPRPFGSGKLQGFENLYRNRVGKRVIYEIDKSASTVTVAEVEHRKSVYRHHGREFCEKILGLDEQRLERRAV